MKKLIIILLLLTSNQVFSQTYIIKDEILFIRTKETYYNVNGKSYVCRYYVEGKGKDTNFDGKISRLIKICKLKNKNNLTLKTI